MLICIDVHSIKKTVTCFLWEVYFLGLNSAPLFFLRADLGKKKRGGGGGGGGAMSVDFQVTG